MTAPTPCVRLPFLRGPLSVSGVEEADAPAASAPQAGPAAALLLWPGLPSIPQQGLYCPADYPFSQREAAACLEDLRQMGDAALSGLPVGVTAANNPRAARRASEMALLREIGGADNEAALKAEAARKLRIELEQAQKALIWVWLQEERMGELADMAQTLAQKSSGFTLSLGLDEADAGEASELTSPGAYGGAGILGAPISLDLGLMPPWKMVTANAMYFLPPDLPILAEGTMAEDLLEALDFVPATESALADAAALADDSLLCARAPAWRIMGRTRPTGSQALDAERLWLVRRAAS
ncbi:hypothetical protein [Desulfovibrio intestinalis]|uniref:Uncharacterized protein n=1 Tax=Desulfovibrio intestinalis TaxID=58621 RepID=A0A7W8FH29_9BACT|nr:hypothetical protein [Desulfovibrio intestinalis]MBB5144440.1 hypothetical protein [Desulfovibrio intestinalis]